MIRVDYVDIDNARFKEVCRLYFAWKDLNHAVKSVTSRGINFPDLISEQMVCFALKLKWNKGSVAGDATDEKENLIEIKATSNYNSDLSSFSPNTKFDRLLFFRLNQSENFANIYDLKLNNTQFEKLPVNSTQCVRDQQESGRRPRLSLIKYINHQDIKPLCKIDIINQEII